MAEQEQGPETKTEETQDESKETQNEPLTRESIQKMIQAEADRVRTEYSRKLKETESERDRIAQEKEALETEKMSESEKAKYEIEKMRKEAEQTKAEAEQAKHEAWFTRALHERGLPSDLDALMRRPTNDEEMDAWNAAYNALVQRDVKKGINDALVTSMDPPKSGDGNGAAFNYADAAARRKMLSMPPGPEKERFIAEMIELNGVPILTQQ